MNTALPIIAILLIMVIAGYSIWINNLGADVNIYVSGVAKPTIGSYKAFVNYYLNNFSCVDYRGFEDYQVVVSSDNESVSIIYENRSSGVLNISMWIGLVISNEGGVPVNIYSLRLVINGYYGEHYFNQYFYGPYKTGIGYREWGRVDPCQLPYQNYSLSIVIDSGWKTIVWINVFILNIVSITNATLIIQYASWNTV